MEELDLKELFEIFWHKKAQIILLILIFMVSGLIYSVGFVTPMYTSSTTLVLVGTESVNDTETQQTESITPTDITINSKFLPIPAIIHDILKIPIPVQQQCRDANSSRLQ